MTTSEIIPAFLGLVLGEKNRAIDEFTLAVDEGWRTFYGNRLDEHPWYLKIENEPRVVVARKIIDAYVSRVGTPVRNALRDK